ncbi:uncharacterized protein BO88DRAFT_456285 [Aspergillus vadensis CBS 113365]|uniref:DUF7708 domain-containing protein n=1 Tax=Aspergillus vadensis (strain CBS 113365 / IMI 142717 / IBT 24658) TaxID=1448311 RepID=A0A319BL57_ASPVC|nr:hypothetical protein BO88DRAFT_456285 [Aspergillus vadensis CBS 113365]PYH66433.1 hypothetical protein BO88DRAFT_456285 [Aspergillus vadensis CBS 113365]
MDHFRRRAGEAITHVRQFSSKAKNEQPEEPWVKSLDEHVKWEVKEESEGRRLFSESTDQTIRLYRDGSLPKYDLSSSPIAFDESDELKEITKELEEMWKKAIKDLIEKRGDDNNDLAKLINDPTPERLEAVVRTAQSELEAKTHTKVGRAKGWFVKVAGRINNHKYLLDMLPSGDRYTSVLIGGLTACIKATLEHEAIAELISDCLEKLSDKTYKLSKAIRNSKQNDFIRTHIVKFYKTLFGLLVSILDHWLLSRAKRFKNSLGSSFQNQLQCSMNDLDYHVKQLSEENNSIMMENMCYDLGQLVQAIIVGGYSESWPTATNASNQFRTPGQVLAVSESPSAAPYVIRGLPDIPESKLAASVAPGIQDKHNDHYWSTQTILEDTAWMKEYVCFEREENLLEESLYGSTNPQVYSRLVHWAQSKSSEALWLEGPAIMADTTPNTLITARIVETFRRLHVPIVSFFCEYDSRQYNTFSNPEELLKMVYSLTSQMLAFIQDNLSSVYDSEDLPDFSPARIRRLTTDPNSLPDAIAFLKDIIPLGPPILACCIDGLQILDCPEQSRWYQDCLTSFIQVLGTTKPPQPRIMKVWFSTDGYCEALQVAVNAGWIEADITNSEDDTEPLEIDHLM